MAFTVPAWVLWLQAGYSLWTFLRNAKFFRIPFILLSMAWHGFNATWFGQRKYLLLDGRSRETGGDWHDYDTEEERKSHSFSLKNSHDMRFKLKEKDYRFCASHNTSSELLNANFMRILSILPLALQAKGYDQFSTLVSATLVIMDIFSYFFNFVWQACKVFTFKYTKLALARLPVKYRVFIHELLNTGTDSFMYCDDSLKKAYYKTVDRVMVLRGCEIPLDATTADLPNVGELPERLEIKMNLNTFLLEIESVGDLYNISITDRNNYRERREYLERGYTIKLINYFKYCDETGNYPFRHIKTGSAHVLNPVKAMIDGVYEWALTVRLKQPRKLFISDSTI